MDKDFIAKALNRQPGLHPLKDWDVEKTIENVFSVDEFREAFNTLDLALLTQFLRKLKNGAPLVFIVNGAIITIKMMKGIVKELREITVTGFIRYPRGGFEIRYANRSSGEGSFRFQNTWDGETSYFPHLGIKDRWSPKSVVIL